MTAQAYEVPLTPFLYRYWCFAVFQSSHVSNNHRDLAESRAGDRYDA